MRAVWLVGLLALTAAAPHRSEPIIGVIIACDEHPGIETCDYIHHGPYATERDCESDLMRKALAIARDERDPRDIAGKPYCVPKRLFDEAAMRDAT